MRLSDRRSKRDISRFWLRVGAAIVLCGVAMPSMAVGLIQTLPHVGLSAAALSLTLITAAIRHKN
jgi:hypothetical protein